MSAAGRNQDGKRQYKEYVNFVENYRRNKHDGEEMPVRSFKDYLENYNTKMYQPVQPTFMKQSKSGEELKKTEVFIQIGSEDQTIGRITKTVDLNQQRPNEPAKVSHKILRHTNSFEHKDQQGNNIYENAKNSLRKTPSLKEKRQVFEENHQDKFPRPKRTEISVKEHIINNPTSERTQPRIETPRATNNTMDKAIVHQIAATIKSKAIPASETNGLTFTAIGKTAMRPEITVKEHKTNNPPSFVSERIEPRVENPSAAKNAIHKALVHQIASKPPTTSAGESFQPKVAATNGLSAKEHKSNNPTSFVSERIQPRLETPLATKNTMNKAIVDQIEATIKSKSPKTPASESLQAKTVGPTLIATEKPAVIEVNSACIPPPPPPPPLPFATCPVATKPVAFSKPVASSKPVAFYNTLPKAVTGHKDDTDAPAKVNKNDPRVKKLVYGALREMYGNYHDKANDYLATLPKNRVKKNNGLDRIIDSIASQGGLDKLCGRMNPKSEEE